jgi:hypothetical protein
MAVPQVIFTVPSHYDGIKLSENVKTAEAWVNSSALGFLQEP